jgi:GntR family transcriptional regulator, transcriptional repressor for pyruvate dehydrogenase complex
MRRRYHEVMLELGDAIIGAGYGEGTWLPNVDTLHERFGCSKGVVREALRGLEERGLVEVHPGRGAKVRQREEWDTRNPHVLRACIERGPEPDLLWQAIEARAAVECEAAARAIESAADDDFRLLLGNIEAMERAVAGSEFVAAEVWFHRTLALLSDNALLAKLSEPLHGVLAQIRRERAPQRDGAAIRHHRRILEGLSSRDTELAAESILAYAERLGEWVGARR